MMGLWSWLGVWLWVLQLDFEDIMIWYLDAMGLGAVTVKCFMLGLHDDWRGAAGCPYQFMALKFLEERAARGISEIA